MTAYEIPLTPEGQTFRCNLSGTRYAIGVRWNHEAGAWVMDLSTDSGELIVGGIALTTGADLLEQYGYLGIGGSIFVQTDSDTNAMPTADNLGITSHVYFVVE